MDVPYAKHDEMSKGITTTPFEVNGQKLINVEPWVLTKLAEHCITEIEHHHRPPHTICCIATSHISM